jgi:RNA polymerase sigma-70 factor (ECF subfamily)
VAEQQQIQEFHRLGRPAGGPLFAHFPDQTKLKIKNMKTKTLLTTLMIGAICQFAPQICHAQDVDSMAPVVVKTVPEAGSKDVPPGEFEIKVKFSKEMMDQSWSWSSAWKNSDPETVGKPKYEADQKTCVLKVKLEPNKTYGYWINSQNFHGFKDAQGHSAVPYLLVFQTK